ncbi:hypothetical protein [Flavobacterium gelatinilyticum]|uniref:hypothetical protein n=1 Tax=Flavobacterium gelatinilyticum TaxID=3003260 RepID=UPI002480A473|nr:hypothetical protein [Flavobacterium gelatinilyticum]
MKKIKKSTFKIQQYFILLITVITLSSLTSCSTNDDKNEYYELPVYQNNPKEGGYPILTKQVPYVNIKLTTEPQKLIYDSKLKDVSISTIKDTVVVFIEGGPTHIASTDALTNLESIITPSEYPNYSVVAVRQAHNMNPTVFGSGSSFTNANAQQVNDKTNEILKTVISWLKSNRKVVYLYGHSNGSFIVQDYMTTNNTKADAYIISATRLKPVQVIFDTYAKNNDFSFPNGITPVITQIPANELPYFNAMSKLQLNHMKNYISLLANNPMLPKTVYLLSGKDEALGATENDENDFITNNKIAAFQIPNGTHGEAPFAIPNALKYLRKK